MANTHPGSQPNYTSASDAHVYPRHHHLTQYPNKSKFVSGEGQQSFALEVRNHDSALYMLQADGRHRYDVSDLGRIVGTSGCRCGRVVLKPTGEVIIHNFRCIRRKVDDILNMLWPVVQKSSSTYPNLWRIIEDMYGDFQIESSDLMFGDLGGGVAVIRNCRIV
jgi:hypothetical protein